MALQRGRRKGRLTAQGVSDFRFGIDRVERRGTKAFVVDSEGLYAPVEVEGDTVPPSFADNLAKLSKAQAASMFEAIRLSPYLSREGKRERLAVLLQSGLVKLQFNVFAPTPKAPRSGNQGERGLFNMMQNMGEEEALG